MCFFNRLRFKCGHTQTCIFQTCGIARNTRGRTYHTTCRPSRRSNRNVRTWDLLGSCENCLRFQYGRHGYLNGIYNNGTPGIGVPGDRMFGYDGYGYGYGHNTEGYYPYYPAGDRFYNHTNGYMNGGYNPRYWDRGSYGYSNLNNPFHNYNNIYNPFNRRHSLHQITPLNPDECDEAGCMNINTPKDIQRNFHRNGWGSPYMGSRGLGGGGRLLDHMGYNYGVDDGRYMYQDDVDGIGLRGINPNLEATPLRAIEGGDGFDAYEGVGRRSPFVGRRARVSAHDVVD
ncbi:hypothetical protein TWF718_008607 [Orbilia javanica]|uniref:Uncharacterized protein n=1 Tax=Orbilia javanica TaxID=47235 RepID=A0AAN8RFJ1_9PEZI